MTCPPVLVQQTAALVSGVDSITNEFPSLRVALWYKDATNLIIKEGDVVAVTKAQVNEYNGTKKLNTKHCSHHIYINPSTAEFEEVATMNVWAAGWFNFNGRQPAPALATPSSTFQDSVSMRASEPSSPTRASHSKSELWSLTPQQVGEWLMANNLGRYSQNFEENEISGDILSQLPSQILQELGVKPLGHRFVIMNAFSRSKVDSLGAPSSAKTLPANDETVGKERAVFNPFNIDNVEEFITEMAQKLARMGNDRKLSFLEHLKDQGCPDEILQKLLVYLSYDKYNELKNIAVIANSRLLGIFNIGSLNAAIRNEESYQKKLYTSISNTSASAHPDAHTVTSRTPRSQIKSFKVSIFENYSQFVRRELDDSEKDTTSTLFATPPPDYYTDIGNHSVVDDHQTFRRNFVEYTRAQLSNFNWNNMVVAGGTVFTCLKRETNKSNMFQGPSQSGDIDVFLIGLDAASAERKIHALYNHVKHSNQNPIIVVRTSFALSFICQHPYRTIQVILRLYKTIEEVLCYFDLDCVAVAYDGAQVYALPRAIRAFNTRTNFIDVVRFNTQSTSNDSRIIKYYRRGFGSVLVKAEKFENSGFSPKVLAKIMDLQHKEDITDPVKGKERRRVDKLLEDADENAEQEGWKEADQQQVKKSDDKYDDTTFIPFGKGWNATKIHEHLTKKLKESEDTHNAKGSLEPFVPFYIVGSFEEVMGLTSIEEFTAKWGSFPHKLKWSDGWA